MKFQFLLSARNITTSMKDKYWFFFRLLWVARVLPHYAWLFHMMSHKDVINIYTSSGCAEWLKMWSSWGPSSFKLPLLCFPSLFHKAFHLSAVQCYSVKREYSSTSLQLHGQPPFYLSEPVVWQVSIFNITLAFSPRDT